LNTAVLDASALHPMAMTYALMSLASAGPYPARWTHTIDSERIASIEERRPDA